MESVILTTNS